MNELSLFTGCGGGLLAGKILGWRPIGYVENEKYCQRTISQRIKDGWLENAPIFTDVRAFNREGYAASYQGMADIITGGFPCQDISAAGRGAGILAGEKSSLWFEMAETVRIVRPRYVFIENSPNLTSRGLNVVLGGIAKMGYDAAWGVVSAGRPKNGWCPNIGAWHCRKRLWIVANRDV